MYMSHRVCEYCNHNHWHYSPVSGYTLAILYQKSKKSQNLIFIGYNPPGINDVPWCLRGVLIEAPIIPRGAIFSYGKIPVRDRSKIMVLLVLLQPRGHWPFHSEWYISDSFQIIRIMMVLTIMNHMILPIMNRTEFCWAYNEKKNSHYDHSLWVQGWNILQISLAHLSASWGRASSLSIFIASLETHRSGLAPSPF